VREIVNLVFAKPVYSYTKFWQMIGRGTRLLEPKKMKPWCIQKDVFLVLDCWDNFEYFKVNPKGKELAAQIPLPVRLFGLRVDKIEKARDNNQTEIVIAETEKLKQQISQLPNNSVVVMEAKHSLQQLEDANFWNLLTESKLEFLRQNVKPLMRTISGVDFKAMRFEKDIVEVSIAHIENDQEKFEALKESIIEEISQLPLSINIVASQESLIRESQTNKFWASINEEKLNELIDKFAPLMKHKDSFTVPLGPAKFNFKDELYAKEYVEFGPQHEALSVARYRELVEEKINQLVSSNPVLQKLKLGHAISDTESEQLAEELHNEHPHITIDLLRRVYNHRKAALTQFIKHILGIEVLETFPETVSKAFDTFIKEHSYLSSRQLQFMDLLKKFILEKGDLQKRDLIQSPFTMLHPEGIRGVFSPKEIDEILVLTNKLLAA
jgi:type I restriction enzyme R subunit